MKKKISILFLMILTVVGCSNPFSKEGGITPFKIADNVNDVYYAGSDYIYSDNNGKYHSFTSNSVAYKSLYIQDLTYSDIKIPYYYNSHKIVYLNNNNKIILSGEVDKYELDLSIESMKKIYDFLR